MVLAFVGWKAFLFLFPSDETRIQKKLNRLASLVSYSPGTSPLAHLASAGGILEMFTADANLHIRADSRTWNLTGRDEIKTAVLSARQQQPGGMEISITDPLFEKPEAERIVTVVTVTVRQGDGLEPMVRILELHWRLGERSQWLIEKIVTRQDLEWGA